MTPLGLLKVSALFPPDFTYTLFPFANLALHPFTVIHHGYDHMLNPESPLSKPPNLNAGSPGNSWHTKIQYPPKTSFWNANEILSRQIKAQRIGQKQICTIKNVKEFLQKKNDTRQKRWIYTKKWRALKLKVCG